MACATNVNNFVNGTITYTDTTTHSYSILNLAKWVSYQSYRSPYYGGIPVSSILGQWGFECGNSNGSWRVDEFQARFNPGNQNSLCTYNGKVDNNNPIPGKRVSFDNAIQGVKAYAHLLIAGYKCVAEAYISGLEAACTALAEGYYVNTVGVSNYCASTSYAENSPSTRRIWATAGYNGLYSTISSTNNTCLNGLNYVQTTDPGLYKFDNISFS